MTTASLYAVVGVALIGLGLFALIVRAHLLRKILAFNVTGSGVFLVLVALAMRTGDKPDPVPHAMIITGIVVAVSATALALVLIIRLAERTGAATLDDDETPPQ